MYRYFEELEGRAVPIDPISELLVFGDSLSDEGIMSGLTSRNLVVTVPTPDSGYSVSFTNGSVYTVTLGGLLSAEGLLASTESYATGGAHAVGSLTFAQYVNARVGSQLPPGEIYRADADPADLAEVIDLRGQVQRYGADPVDRPGAAALFNIGLNDYAEFTPTSPQAAPAEGAALVQAVVQSIIGSAAAVAQTGVQTIILYTLPNFRYFPLSTLRTEPELLLGDQLVAAHNAGLQSGAALLEAAGAEVIFVETGKLMAEVFGDAETFGFRPELMLAPVLLGTGGNPVLVEQPDGSYKAFVPENPLVEGIDRDQLPFWDLVHPTAALHDIWGVFSAESLTSETFFFGDDDDLIRGTQGADLVLAGRGNDTVCGFGGADVLIAGRGNDLVAGGRGADIVAGGAGRDLLSGGRGADVVADGKGNDVSFGGTGRDLLIDGLGFDILHGGQGGDAFLFTAATLSGGSLAGNGGVMFGGSGYDTAYLVLDAATRASVEAELRPGASDQLLTSIGLGLVGIERVVLLDPDDPLDIATPARLAEAELWGFA